MDTCGWHARRVARTEAQALQRRSAGVPRGVSRINCVRVTRALNRALPSSESNFSGHKLPAGAQFEMDRESGFAVTCTHLYNFVLAKPASIRACRSPTTF